jgi:hypothetical protein
MIWQVKSWIRNTGSSPCDQAQVTENLKAPKVVRGEEDKGLGTPHPQPMQKADLE